MKKTGLIFCLLPLTLALFGWGGGHTDHAQLVLQYLPREISSRWSPADQKTFRNRWAHSPDSSARIGEEILRMIGPDSVRVLNECGIQTYYKFHLESGRAAAFLLLVRAFREKNDPAALFFSGVLLHSLADTSAFNHGPLIHFLTYTRYGHVRYPKLKLDLSNMRGNSVFKEKLAARLAGFHPDGGQKSLRETLLSLMLEEIDSNAFMCAREDRLVSTRPDGSPSDAALDAMADVAAYQTRIGVNAICAAWRLARSGEDAGLSASDLEIRAYRKLPKEKRKLSLYSEYERRKGEKIARRDPRTDAVYAGLFNPGKSSPETKKIGLVCEATYAMDQAFLGFGSKFILAMIGRTLQNSGMEVEAIPLFDLRTRKLSCHPLHRRGSSRVRGPDFEDIRRSGRTHPRHRRTLGLEPDRSCPLLLPETGFGNSGNLNLRKSSRETHRTNAHNPRRTACPPLPGEVLLFPGQPEYGQRLE